MRRKNDDSYSAAPQESVKMLQSLYHLYQAAKIRVGYVTDFILTISLEQHTSMMLCLPCM